MSERFTVEQVINAIPGSFGILNKVARKLKCSRSTVANYAKNHQEVRDALKAEREVFADVAESKLVDAVKNGQAWAIGKVLEAFGKDRGYEPGLGSEDKPFVVKVIKGVSMDEL